VLIEGEVLTPLTSINTFDFSIYTFGGKVKIIDAEPGIALVVFSEILSMEGCPSSGFDSTFIIVIGPEAELVIVTPVLTILV
jgi:hypothetical protein